MKKIPLNTPWSRRSFLRRGMLTAAAVTVVPRHVLGGPKHVAPSEKVNIAIIGCGGQGRTNVQALLNEPEAQIVAVCDPNEAADYSQFYYRGMAGRKPVRELIEKHYREKTPGYQCAEYEDFRVLFDKEKGIDAILCATPDHLHALISITAMRLGKHVYCEKPLTHNVWEARLVAKVAKETGVATQMGNQGHSTDSIRTTCEWIWDGAIGTVREVHAWSDAGRWNRQPGLPKDTPPVPAGLNWDLWLGPREFRPYSPDYVPFNWRAWWAFGTGAIADMGIHNIDNAVWALDLGSPTEIEGFGAGRDPETISPGNIVYYQFPARGDRPPVKLTWYDGGLRPRSPEALPDDESLGSSGNGTLFVGDKGMITCPGWGGAPRFIPEARLDSYKRPAKSLARSKGHHRDWLLACKGGPQASSNFAYGARLTEIVLLGDVSLRAGKKIRWDAAAGRVTNVPEAEGFVKESYRRGWEIT